MKKIYYILVSIFLLGCQIEDDSSPSPDEAFIKYFGELSSYEASDIEIVYDATGTVPEGFVVLGTVVSRFGDKDFFVLRTDLDGNFLDSLSFGVSDTLDVLDEQRRFVFDENGEPGDGKADDWTGDGIKDRFRAEEISGQIEFVPDLGNGSPGFAIIGTSAVTINLLNISEWQFMSFGFLDLDLKPITFQGDSLLAIAESTESFFLDFDGTDVIQLSNGNFLLAGAREVDRGGGNVDFDNYFLSLNLSEGIVFEQTQGVIGDEEDDIIMRAFEKENGNLAFIGRSNTASARGENGGFNGRNVFYLETDENGTPINSIAYGIDDSRDPSDQTIYDDFVNDAVQTPIGFSVVGTSDTDDNEQFAFLMNLSSNGIHLNSSAHHFSIFNDGDQAIESNGLGITLGQDNSLILLGQYTSFTSEGQSRGGEGMFVKYSQGATPVVGEESFFGLADGNDEIVDAVTLPDGKIVAVANVDFGGGVKLISIIKMNPDGSLDE